MFDWTDVVAFFLPEKAFWLLCAGVALLLAVLILWIELG
jgi:hypothetical protein